MLSKLQELLGEFQQRDFTLEEMYGLLRDLGDYQYYTKRKEKYMREGLYNAANRYFDCAQDAKLEAQNKLIEMNLDFEVDELIS